MYNPFNKNISEIKYEDLKKLIENDDAEGWFMEYKRSFPENRKIANSIASFANSEGGWYIVGIEEHKNESNPFEIVGFNLNGNKKPDDTITNIIKHNITPIPYFESKIVEIPENKVVLIVQVFEGYDTPYISNNGKVYIRVNGTSEPLKDRYQFEKLLEKKQYFEKKVSSFMDNTFFFDNYVKYPYLEFYVFVNNPKNVLFEDFYSEEFFENLKENFNSKVELADGVEFSASVNFDNIYGSVDSYMIRHVHDNNPLITGITLELFKEGHLKLIFPFNTYNTRSLNNEYESLIHFDSFISEYNDLRIIDLAESIFTFQTILAQYKRLLKKFDCNYDLNFKYKFNNFDLLTPFMDSNEYMEFIIENKLPINLKTSINIPNSGFSKCKFKDFNPFAFAIRIIEATGLPRHLVDVISKGYYSHIKIKSVGRNY